MKRTKTNLLTTRVIPAVAVAGVALGAGIGLSSPVHAKGISSDVAAELPMAKSRAGGIQLAACNPCKPKPCGAANPCNPCGAKTPCGAANPCGAKNPCNPCKPK